MRYLATVLLLATLTACAGAPKCVTAHTIGLSIESTDPRVPAFDLKPTATTVCVSPAYIDG